MKGQPTDAGQFGTFDYAVWVDEKKAKNAKLLPGAGAVFVFDIASSGPFSASDLATASSTIDAGDQDAYEGA